MENFNLTETYELFKSQGVSIIGKGAEEIMTNPSLFESYVTSMVQGADADSQEQMAQLMANTNSHILTESSVSGLAPISSLSGPVIRKLWPTLSMKNAVKTKVATSPVFMINYEKPYYITVEDGEEVRHYVPRPGMLGFDGWTTEDGKSIGDRDYVTEEITLTNGTGVNAAKNVAGSIKNFCFITNTGSAVKMQPLDADFSLDKITFVKAQEASGGNDAVAEDSIKVVNARLGIENTIIYDYKVDNSNYGTILVRVNLAKADVQVSAISTGKPVVAVTVTAHRSVEYNEVSTSWGFEIAREDIRIGTGVHMQSPITVEALTDMKALYQIDGTKRAVNIMSQAMALDTDGRILRFLVDNFKNQPTNKEFNGYPTASDYLGIFDIKAEAGFAGGPKAWREELKPVIDNIAARIKTKTYLGTGIFNIVGNPLDIMLITNVDWSFRGGNNSVDGVSVNYSLGSYYGAAYTYKVVSTEIVPQGMIYIVFIPEEDDQLTYNYYAYSFSTELGYRDPNHANVPSITLCKRDVTKSFLPAIGAVKILGNDANSSYDPFRDVVPVRQLAGGVAPVAGE